MSFSVFDQLNAQQRALVAMGLLLDGHEAVAILEQDCNNSSELTAAAEYFAILPPDLRMPLLGSILRMTLDELHSLINQGE